MCILMRVFAFFIARIRGSLTGAVWISIRVPLSIFSGTRFALILLKVRILALLAFILLHQVDCLAYFVTSDFTVRIANEILWENLLWS